jgi:ABC-2 type transport system permease protein
VGILHRYLTVLIIFVGSSVRQSLEYRTAFYVNSALGAFWLVWATQVARVYYSYANSINGWSYGNLLVLMGVYFIANGFRQVLFSPNLQRIGEYVRTGTLDDLLLKPMDSQFVVSLRYVDITHAADPLLGTVLVIAGSTRSSGGISGVALVAFAIALLSAFLLLYFLNLAMQAICVLAVSPDGLSQLMNGLIDSGRLPVSVYGPVLQAILTVIIPVAFIITTPASILIGKMPASTSAICIAFVATFGLCARLLWISALRRYQGVGS